MHPAAGGPPVVVARLAEHAMEWGSQSRIITTSLFCSNDGSDLAASLKSSVDATVLPVDRPRALGLCSRAASAIEDGVRKADIVHLHTLWHPLNTVARHVCRSLKRKYVLSPHGMLDPYSLGVKSLRKALYMRMREKLNLLGAASLIFTTPFEEELARQASPWLGEGVVIPLGADEPPPSDRETLTEAFIAQFPVVKNRRRLIFLGRLHPKKGLERIIDELPLIAKNCPPVLLIVAGTGDESYVQGLQARANRVGVSGHIHFTGMLRGDAKWGALAASELFVLPSHQENFAIAAAEAMHMGVPVIVSDKVNLWPFVQEAGAGIVVPDAEMPVSLGAAIAQLLEDPGGSRRMGECGKAYARTHFVWRTTTRRTLQLYEKVLARAPEGKGDEALLRKVSLRA